MLNVITPFMLRVIKLNVAILNVVAPILANVEKTSFEPVEPVCLSPPPRTTERRKRRLVEAGIRTLDLLICDFSPRPRLLKYYKSAPFDYELFYKKELPK